MCGEQNKRDVPSTDRTDLYRDVLLAVIALALLSTPVWVSAANVGEPTYTYERAQVVLDSEDGIAFANDSAVSRRVSISDDIGCSNYWDVRPCAFERYLAANNTVPTGIHSTNPDATHLGFAEERYRYVQINGTVYEVAYETNRSVQNDDGLYRVELALEPTSADDALRAVSRKASTERGVPKVAVEAAEEGEATSNREVEVPQTPLRLDDGTYYRVYETASDRPTNGEQTLQSGLSVFGPVVGLLVLYHLSRRVEVTYVGPET